MLDKLEAVEQARALLAARSAESEKLDLVHAYWKGEQDYPILPGSAPREVRHLAEMSRGNQVALVVDVLAQALFVDGFREPKSAQNDEQVWAIWQANGMDSRQIGVHRATAAYGAAYVVVWEGEPHPVMRGVSPRDMTTLYLHHEDDWPVLALEALGRGAFRLYDTDASYWLQVGESSWKSGQPSQSDDVELVDIAPHSLGVCPVVRFRNHVDLDRDSWCRGEIEPLIPLQQQIDHTTFGLMVAQHFQAFRQRYVIGWTADSEEEQAQASAARLWAFDDPDVKVGEFGQVDLGGYLDSRTSSMELLATLSQTPPHHLLGKLVNLSAEALAAAESGQRRKVAERETTWGESWEQVLRLAGQAEGIVVSDSAQVRWRDTEARSLAQVVDALGKAATMLDIPKQALWEKIPGVSDQDIERWSEMARQLRPLEALRAAMEGQMGALSPPPAPPVAA